MYVAAIVDDCVEDAEAFARMVRAQSAALKGAPGAAFAARKRTQR